MHTKVEEHTMAVAKTGRSNSPPLPVIQGRANTISDLCELIFRFDVWPILQLERLETSAGIQYEAEGGSYLISPILLITRLIITFLN